nr:putative E3 ubiquitin-protein ligase RING1a isoform X2 [Ipomoea batatas]
MPAQKRYSSNYQDEDDDESLYEPQQRRNQRRRGKQSRRRGGGGGGEQSRAPEEELKQQQQRIQLERGEQGRAELEELAPNHDQESIRESSEDGYVFSEEYNTYTSTHAPNLFVFANRCTYIHESVYIYSDGSGTDPEDFDELISVSRSDIRGNVQCPICLVPDIVVVKWGMGKNEFSCNADFLTVGPKEKVV